MLDDTEPPRLAEIESWLEANDPKLTRRFTPHHSPRRRLITVALTLLAMIAAIALGLAVAGPPAGIAGGLTVGAVAFGRWLQHRLDLASAPPPET